MTPTVLGRYRLETQVGQGGMAVVWRGFDTQLRRTVAVKVLHAHLHAREEIRRRFDREAHAVARLHHPHILDVYDFSGPEAEPSWLVTEFIRGSTLRTFAETHPFDPPELAACCLLPIAEALAHAHAAGVVHRDLKPENVMVREDGVVKLTDFGIAALLDPDEKFTVTGSILGSPAHLAPETIEGKPADPRSDLFSFGTIFYWLSCGELPFRAPSPAALLRLILDGELKDPRTVRPSVSDSQARIILRCLERDPSRRFQSAQELHGELSRLLTVAGIEDPAAECKAFVVATHPEEQARGLRTRLSERAFSQGEKALSEGRTGAALAAFGRVLALDPADARARARLDHIRRRTRLFKLAQRAAVAAVALACVAAAGIPTARALQRWRSAHPRVAAATSAAPATEASAPLDPRSAPPAPAVPSQASPQPPEFPAAAKRRPARGRTRPPPSPAVGVAPAPHVVAAGKIPVTLQVHWLWADVTLDGAPLGSGPSFRRELTPGRHVAVVRHPCCADREQTIEVVPSRDHYTLEHGTAKDARLQVENAPSDARVLVDGGFLSTVADLASRPIAVGDRPMRTITVTVGDREGRVELQGGQTKSVDYLSLSKRGEGQ